MRTLAIVLLVCLSGCARAPIKSLDEAMRPAERMPEQVTDDLGLKQMLEPLRANISHLRSRPGSEVMNFGPQTILKADYIKALEHLADQLELDPSGESFMGAVKEDFQWLEVYGGKDWGEVFITSYFDPVFPGSKKRTKKFSQAIYEPPADLVDIHVGQFAQRLPVFEPLKDRVLEQKSRDKIARGRLVKEKEGQSLVRPLVVPYYDRSEIDMIPSPLRKAKVLAYADPIDVFFLQIQGSGTIQTSKNREVRVGYAAQNGHPYVAIGRHLLDVIPKEKMSLARIEDVLRKLPMEKQQEIFNKNPSYVFFQKLKGGALSYFGTEVAAGRTIATDYTYFPKGALAHLEYEKPEFADPLSVEPSGWSPSARFVLDQDTGGAIRGPHRVDLFWGRGDEAKRVAGVMKNHGRLRYLVPRPELVERLRTE